MTKKKEKTVTKKTGNFKTYTGRFFPRNPKKYKGNVDNIIYRSGWELRAFKYFDENAFVLEWQSEELVIPYYDPATGRHRRYFPDIVAVVKEESGKVKTIVIEIKPRQQTQEPKVQKRITRRYITEVSTWATNNAKWKAAEDFCELRGWEFVIMTEKELGITYK